FMEYDSAQKGAAVQLLDVVARDRKPERNGLIDVADVDGHERMTRAGIAREDHYASRLVPVPVVKDEVSPVTDLRPVAPEAQQLSSQGDGTITGLAVQQVPA